MLDPAENMFFPVSSSNQLTGRHKKSTINAESPNIEFLNATIDSLKGTIAKNELELKKLREANDLKLKRIMQLEAQVEESRATFTKHKCEKVAAVIEGQANLPQALETRTLTLEHKFLYSMLNLNHLICLFHKTKV